MLNSGLGGRVGSVHNSAQVWRSRTWADWPMYVRGNSAHAPTTATWADLSMLPARRRYEISDRWRATTFAASLTTFSRASSIFRRKFRK